MPCTFTIEAKDKRIDVIAEGQVTCTEGAEVLTQIRSHPAFDASFDVLIDLRRAVSNPSVQDVRRLIQSLPIQSDENTNKIAIMVGNSFHYGMVRMAMVWAESKKAVFYVFLQAAEARKWLESPVPGPPAKGAMLQ